MPSDGNYCWHLARAVPMNGRDGKTIGWFGCATDIDDQKRAEEALRSSEAKYRRLHQSMMDAFVGVDMDGRIQEYNAAYQNMLGYAPEELLALRYTDITPEKWHSFEAEIVQKQILSNGYSDTYEKEYRRKDGTVFPVELRTFLLTDDAGRPAAMWAIVRDITERRRARSALQKAHDDLERRVEERTVELAKANEALRESNQQLQTIYDGIVEGLLITGIETKRIRQVNVPFCRMLGYSEGELLGMCIPDLHPPEEVPNDLQRFQAAAEGRVSINEDRPVLRKDGSVFYADISGHPIVYKGQPCLLALFRDVTERRQAQEALRREHRTLKHLLQSSDRERQTIAYDIHDGLAQQLAGAVMQFQTFDHLKDKQPKLASKAYDAGLTMLQQGHFEARRLIANVRHPILDEQGVVEAIAHLVHEQRRSTRARITFNNTVDFDRLVPILENAIYRIAQEALANACQHSESKRVRVSLSQRKDRVRIEVRDYGKGFDTKMVKGEHFGLEGIRQRARLLGGKCSIRSTEGKGTRVTVELPVAKRKEAE
jgi:PAS domain S-box-containing protein